MWKLRVWSVESGKYSLFLASNLVLKLNSFHCKYRQFHLSFGFVHFYKRGRWYSVFRGTYGIMQVALTNSSQLFQGRPQNASSSTANLSAREGGGQGVILTVISIPITITVTSWCWLHMAEWKWLLVKRKEMSFHILTFLLLANVNMSKRSTLSFPIISLLGPK
jgi:hypothetical protein